MSMSNGADRNWRSVESFDSDESVNEAMRRAGLKAFQYHAWTQSVMWVWHNGQIVKIDPNDPDAELPEGFDRPEQGPPPWVGL